MIDLTTIWAFIIAFAVFVYVVMDGFDLGLGILFPLFPGKQDRDVITNTVAPVWDGNETWLVLGGAGLFLGLSATTVKLLRYEGFLLAWAQPARAALLIGAGMSAAAQDITVSSKIDTEGGLLGNVILLALEHAGMPVENRLQLGGTPIVRDAIASGQIDIYPEYTANGAFFFNEADSPVWKDAAQGYARVAELDKEQNDIVWLTPSPANNTWAIALRQDVAQENGLTTMTQMGEWIAGGGQVKLAASTEFVTSPAALPAFQETYGFALTPDQLVQLAGGDTAATIAAAAQQTSGVNAAMVYGTDGAIAEAAKVRLRPILMTTAAMVTGLLPLLTASGAGAASRFSIGLVVVAGMSIGTLFTLFVLPTFYILIARDHRAAATPRLESVAARGEIAA